MATVSEIMPPPPNGSTKTAGRRGKSLSHDFTTGTTVDVDGGALLP